MRLEAFSYSPHCRPGAAGRAGLALAAAAVCALYADTVEAAPEYASGDGTLNHDAQVCESNLDERLLVPPGGRWDGARILNGLGQLDTASYSDNQEVRCGASSLLAGAIMNGKESTLGFVERLSAQAGDPVKLGELNAIRDRLHEDAATNGDAHRVQSLTYQLYDSDSDPGLSTEDLIRAQRDLTLNLGSEHEGVAIIEPPLRTRLRLLSMPSGHSTTLFVDTDQDGEVNHAVQVGSDRYGVSYIYDPYPAVDQPHVMHLGSHPDRFNLYTGGSLGVTTPSGDRGTVTWWWGACSSISARSVRLVKVSSSSASSRASRNRSCLCGAFAPALAPQGLERLRQKLL